MSFDLDDPLAGILSDGSDDSFFDDDILGKKKNKKSTPIFEKKAAVFNLGDNVEEKAQSNNTLNERKNSLFDLTEKSNNPDGVKNTTEKGFSPVPFRQTLTKESFPAVTTDPFKTHITISKSPAKGKSSNSADKLDLLEDLTSGTKKDDIKALERGKSSQSILDDLNSNTKKDNIKTLQRGKSSQSILDDILGGTSTKTVQLAQSAIRPNTGVKSQDSALNDLSLSGKVESQVVPKSKNDRYSTTVRKVDPLEKKSKLNDDWLGIFGNDDTESAQKDDAMPSWLLGANSKTTKGTNKEKTYQRETGDKVTTNENPEKVVVNVKHISNINNVDQVTTQTAINSLFHESNHDITANGAALYLQQQESQLMVALQLKAQEEKLAALQMRQEESQKLQREASKANQVQLDAILHRHISHREQMQSVIAAHQDRINERIKALLSSSVIDDQNNVNIVEDGGNQAKVETPHSKEKKQLLQLVQCLQENHDKEIDLMETSYRRQLAFLEVSLSQSEERMKEESDKLVKFYTEKITWLDEHHQAYKQLAEDNLQSLRERHREEGEMLRRQHLDNIKILQEHHCALMENVKNAVKQEQALIQESAVLYSNIKDLVADVKENKTSCQDMFLSVKSLVDTTQRDSEKNIQTKDSYLNELIHQLKRERDQFETEKSETRDVVKLLETRLKQMTQFVEEEAASMKQKRMEFEFEKATFNKQTEFAKNVLKKQDEEMKNLREEIQKEYQEKISRIEEDRARIQKDSKTVAKEKSTLQSLKLDLEKMKAELQIQLEEASEDRSKLNIEKQHIQMEGQRISAKSRDLELLAKAAIEKQSQADLKYSEAEHLQRKYEERIRKMQEHVVSLNAREKHVAREKVALSRERLNIHNEKRQAENRQQCSLCKSMQSIPEVDAKISFPDSYLSMPVGATRDYYNVEVGSAMNAIEDEMAHLLSRNLGVRLATASESVGADKHIPDAMSVTTNELYMNASNGDMKDYMDPKLLMLRMDVQRLISNIDHKTDRNNEEN